MTYVRLLETETEKKNKKIINWNEKQASNISFMDDFHKLNVKYKFLIN